MAERIDKKRFDKFKKKFWVSRKEFAETMMLPNALDNVMALLEDEKFEEAQSNIEILLRLDAPKDIRIMLSGLDIEYYIVKGDFATASNKVEALIKINKNNPHAYFYKAQLLMKQNKLNYALNEIDICLEKVENLKMPIPHPDFYFLKSIILKKMDNDEYTYYEEKAKQLMNGLSKLFR